MTRMTITELLAITGGASGVVGAAAGVGALSWQVHTHRQSGRRVTVKASYLIPVYGPPHVPEFHDDDQIAIDVINRGGAAVTILNYGVAIGPRGSQDSLFVLDRVPWATQLPAQVQPGGLPAQLLVPVDELRRAHSARGVPFKRMRPWVELGDGRRVFSENAVPLK